MSINQIPSIVGLGSIMPTAEAPVASGFEAQLEAAISQVSNHQNAGDVRLSRLSSGDDVDVHSTMIALEEADIALRLMVSTRDAAVDAFEKIQNMQI